MCQLKKTANFLTFLRSVSRPVFFYQFQNNIKRGRGFQYPMCLRHYHDLLGMDCCYRYMNNISGIILSVSIEILLVYFTHVLHDFTYIYTFCKKKNQCVNNFPNWLSFLDYQKQHKNMWGSVNASNKFAF